MLISLVIPTRNRQSYCYFAVKSALASTNQSFEVVVLDNSDDRRKIFDALAEFSGDLRLKIVGAAESGILPMKDNWERLLDKTTGEWITVIGDDDCVFPEMIDSVCTIAGAHNLDTEVIGWDRVTYQWPDNRTAHYTPVTVSMHFDIKRKKTTSHMQDLFSWSGNSRNPGGGVGIYHSAIKRTLLNRIREARKGRLFIYSTPDFDNGYTNMLYVESFLWVRRPLTILGACKDSNSAMVNSYEKTKQIVSRWKSEGGDIDTLERTEYPSELGLVTWVYNFQKKFISDNALNYSVDEKNVLRKLAIECEFEEQESQFDLKVGLVQDLLKARKRHDLLEYFSPKFSTKNKVTFRGMINGYLFLQPDVFSANNIYEFMTRINELLPPASYIGTNTTVDVL